MKLNSGDAAVAFEVTDIFGQPRRLEDYKDKKLLLSFYRYASCPLCNLRVHRLIQAYDELHEHGLHMLAFFESPKESIIKHVGKHDAPFPIVGDPERSLYKKYGVESSWSAFFKSMIVKMPALMTAMFKGFMPGKMEGHKHLLPADFLVAPDLSIKTAYYGANIGDHLPIEEIQAWVKES
jgi:peroxiredoxin